MQTARLTRLINLSHQNNLDYFYFEGQKAKYKDYNAIKSINESLGYGLQIFFEYLTNNHSQIALHDSKYQNNYISSTSKRINYQLNVDNPAITVWENRKRIEIIRKTQHIDAILVDIEILKKIIKRYETTSQEKFKNLLEQLFDPIIVEKNAKKPLKKLGHIKINKNKITVYKKAPRAQLPYVYNPLYSGEMTFTTEIIEAFSVKDMEKIDAALKDYFKIDINAISLLTKYQYMPTGKKITRIIRKKLLNSPDIISPTQNEILNWLEQGTYKNQHRHWLEIILWTLAAITTTSYIMLTYTNDIQSTYLMSIIFAMSLLFSASAIIITLKN